MCADERSREMAAGTQGMYLALSKGTDVSRGRYARPPPYSTRGEERRKGEARRIWKGSRNLAKPREDEREGCLGGLDSTCRDRVADEAKEDFQLFMVRHSQQRSRSCGSLLCTSIFSTLWLGSMGHDGMARRRVIGRWTEQGAEINRRSHRQGDPAMAAAAVACGMDLLVAKKKASD